MKRNRFLPTLLVSALAVTLGASLATSKTQDANLPDAKDVINKYLDAVGGKAAAENIKTVITTGAFELPAMGLKGTLKIQAKQPGMLLVHTDIPGFGQIEQGTNGQIAWSVDPNMGPRLLSGGEKAQFMRQADMLSEWHWEKYFTDAKTVGMEDVDGKSAIKVEFTPKEGGKETRYFDKDSGLLLRVDVVVQSAMGDMPASSFLSDYRKIGEITIPFKNRQVAGPTEFTITIEDVKQNVDIPDSVFEPPAEVKALSEKQKEGANPSDAPPKMN
jgi:outer membrane lipoprotein-sorting protein